MTKLATLMLLATCTMFADMPYGKDLVNGQVTINLVHFSSNPMPGLLPIIEGVPTQYGVMVMVKTENPSIEAFKVEVDFITVLGTKVTTSVVVDRWKLSYTDYTTVTVVSGEDKLGSIEAVRVTEYIPLSSPATFR
jgi:hypothetical protein